MKEDANKVKNRESEKEAAVATSRDRKGIVELLKDAQIALAPSLCDTAKCRDCDEKGSLFYNARTWTANNLLLIKCQNDDCSTESTLPNIGKHWLNTLEKEEEDYSEEESSIIGGLQTVGHLFSQYMAASSSPVRSVESVPPLPSPHAATSDKFPINSPGTAKEKPALQRQAHTARGATIRSPAHENWADIMDVEENSPPPLPLKKRQRDDPASGRVDKKTKAGSAVEPRMLLTEMEEASRSDEEARAPTRAEFQRLLAENKRLQRQVESLSDSLKHLKVAMAKMTTQRPVAEDQSGKRRGASHTTESTSYVASEEELADVRRCLSLPNPQRNQALGKKLDPLVATLYPEHRFRTKIIEWLLTADDHDDEYIYNLFARPGMAADEGASYGVNLEVAEEEASGNKGERKQSYASKAAAPARNGAPMSRGTRARQRDTAMSFFAEREAPQEWHSTKIIWHPKKEYRVPGGQRELNKMAWRALEKMGIRNQVRDISLIGFSVIIIYYCSAVAAKVQAALQDAKVRTVETGISEEAVPGKAATDNRQKAINRVSYLCARHKFIPKLVSVFLEELPEEWREECKTKTEERRASYHDRRL
jgi:hypothetical protein